MESHNTITVAGFKKAADPSIEVTIPRELGPVRLLHEIGRGGMGVVYLGRHRMLDRDVAVKFLLHAVAGPDDPGFAGFLEGARAAAAVQHPSLTAIHHADVVDGIPYLVMQYIDGPTLGEVLKKTGPLSLSALHAVLGAVSEAIGELHDREIVHRDIKPANILLDREGRVFVTDFGLACSRPRAQRGQASTGLAGTPTYMAPEMFDGAVSLRSDVYALGITSFELLTGKSPSGGTLDEVREKHVHQALPVELLQEQDVAAELIEVIERAMHKDAMYRYKTARHFGAALKSGVATEEVLKDGASELHRVVARSLHKDSDATTPETAEKSPTSTYFDCLSEIAGEKRASREPSDKADPESSPHDENAEAPSLPPGDEPVGPGSIASGGSRPTGALDADVLCAHCGYNVRGLPETGRCPECGTPIARSVRGDLLSAADPEWLQRVYRGQTYIAVGCVLLLAEIPGTLLIAYLNSVFGTLTYVWEGCAAFHSILSMIFVFVGVVGITTLDPRLSLTEQPLVLRRVVRAAAVATLLLAPLSDYLEYLISVNVSVDAWISVTVGLASILALIFTVVAASYYLAYLAQRIPDVDMAQRTRVTAKGFAICLAVVGTGLILGEGGQSLFGPSRIADVLVWVVRTIGFLFGLGFLLAAFSLLGLWRKYRRVFRGCLLEARGIAVGAQAGKIKPANGASEIVNIQKLALVGQANSDADLQDLDKLVETFTGMIVEDGQTELEDLLGTTLHRRGIALADQGRSRAALEDFDRAIEIFSRLIEERGQTQLVDEFTQTLDDRDVLLETTDSLDKD